MTVYLKDLFLGSADGDDESNKDNFKDLFYTGNNKYNEIAFNNSKFIISGQKGTGKTILGRYLEEKYIEKGIECKIFNKNNLTLTKLIEKRNDVLSNDESVSFFKWMIYLEIYKILRDININVRFRFSKEYIVELKKKKEYEKNIEKLTEIYDTRFPKGNFEFIDYITGYEDEIEGELAIDEKLKSKVRASKKRNLTKNNRRKEFYKVLEEFENLIFLCLEQKSVVFILDDLDELEIKIDNNVTPLTSIKKLIDAFKDINRKINKKKLNPSKCIMLIRSDILKSLNKTSTNLNKILADNTVELYWINKEESEPEKHILMEMILNKIKHSALEYSSLDNKTLYNKIFPKDINGDTALKYLIDYSFGRPRDIIYYLNLMIKKYGDNVKFEKKMFEECRKEYSEWFLDELYNEMNIHIPIEEVDEYLKLIRILGYRSFFINQITKSFFENKKQFKYIKNKDDVIKALSVLYKFGIIGNSWNVNVGKENEKIRFSWGYRKDGKPNIILDQKFSVHYALRNSLNL